METKTGATPKTKWLPYKRRERVEDRIRELLAPLEHPVPTSWISEQLEITQDVAAYTLRRMRGAWIVYWGESKGRGRKPAMWRVNADPKAKTPPDAPYQKKA